MSELDTRAVFLLMARALDVSNQGTGGPLLGRVLSLCRVLVLRIRMFIVEGEVLRSMPLLEQVDHVLTACSAVGSVRTLLGPRMSRKAVRSDSCSCA